MSRSEIRPCNKFDKPLVVYRFNCAPLVADLFLLCYVRDFMTSLSDDKQADIIDIIHFAKHFLNFIVYNMI